MQCIRIRRGLDLPISGEPRQQIGDGPTVNTVAVVAPDYVGMKPTMHVKVGDRVKEGQLLFVDKRTVGVRYTAPGCGEVVAVNRGPKRALLSVVIQLDGEEAETFAAYEERQLESLPRQKVVENLVQSGLWTVLRRRPFSKVPSPDSSPRSIFVTAMDTSPLAADAALVLAERPEDFVRGLKVVSRLTEGKVFVCTAPGSAIAGGELGIAETVQFEGPHPAGLPGTHIHLLDPVDRRNVAWYLNYQDVMAVGRLFETGQLDFRRVISLAGPPVEDPRLIRARVGASTSELTEGELAEGENRVISGSVLCGRTAEGPVAFLGRYHLQISALAEKRTRELFGWLWPGFDRFSVKNVFASSLTPGKKFACSTAAYGSGRAVMPIGSYRKVMPLDIVPSFLLKALAVEDVEQAEALGCLELDEEDLALCTFVCPGKGDYGAILRRNLTAIEKEG